MALKPCQGCGREVDELAEACPGCGRPRPAVAAPSLGGGIARIAFAVGVVILWAITCSVLRDDKPAGGSVSEPDPIAESKLVSMRSWKPGPVCTCGVVQSSAMPTESNLVGQIYLSEKASPRNNEVSNAAVCWWQAFAAATRPPYPLGTRLCVRGTYDAPTIRDCKIVPSCQ